MTAHIVHGSATALQNLTKCVRQAGVRPDELVVSSIASGEAVLSETERELGVAVADIGAGTTDIALYAEGSPFHTSVVPLGGVNVTNDIAIGLRTNLVAAEQLKIRFGSADRRSAQAAGDVPVEVVDDGVARPARPSDIAEIIEARMRELFEKIGDELAAAGDTHRLPAGLVLTGRRVAAGGRRRARPRRPAHAGPRRVADRGRRADRPSAHARLLDLDRAAALGGARRHEPRRRSATRPSR